MRPMCIAIILFFLTSVSGCGNAADTLHAARVRADAANPLRLSLGLRVIGAKWLCFRSINGLDEWVIEESNSSADKIVQYDGEGGMLWEEDSYHYGRHVTMDHQSVEEQLLIRYYYRAKKVELSYIGRDPVVRAAIEGTAGMGPSAALLVADKIIKGWGGTRL